MNCAEPRAVYVHVPFCRRRCGYCNFTLLAGRDDLADNYLEAIERELATVGRPREVDTLFLGGGTPTHLRPEQLARLLRAVRTWFPPAPGFEWSVEGNPEDLTPETVAVLAGEGVNRLSLGVQSFAAGKLHSLEREHRPAQVVAALHLARPRFRSLAVDLIFAAPGESLDEWQADLQSALAFPLDHISTYGLTFERGTAFGTRLGKGTMQRVPEELEGRMYETALEVLATAGFEHYEVSNFARAGHRCRHNETYWQGREYFAFGPGAARYVAGRRQTNHRSTTTWLKRLRAGQSPVAEEECLAAEDRARERLVFGLRQMAGVEREPFTRETGFSPEQLGGVHLARFLELKLIEWHGPALRLTRAGLLVSDSLWPYFLRV